MLNEQHWKISIEEKVISQYINFLCCSCSPLSSDFLCQSEFLHRSEHICRSIRYWFKQLRNKNFNFRLIISSVVLCCKKKIKFKANRVWFITLIVRYMSHIKNHHVSHLAVRGDLLHLLSWSSILSSSWQQETMPVASIQNLRFVWVRSHSPELRRKSIAVIERLGGEKKNSGIHDKQHFYLFSMLRMSFRWCWWIIHPGADPLTALHLLGFTFHWRN